MLTEEEKARFIKELRDKQHNEGIPGTREHFKVSSIPGSIEF